MNIEKTLPRARLLRSLYIVTLIQCCIFPELIDSRPIAFTDTTFSNRIDEEFWVDQIEGGLHGVIIDRQFLPISRIVFEQDLLFNNAKFDSMVLFTSSLFRATTRFRDAIFGASCEFGLTEFRGFTTFMGAEFSSRTNFLEAKFNSEVWFLGTRFDSSVYFGGTVFASTVNFQAATFSNSANFNRAQFLGKTNFNYATLPSTLDFRNVIVSNKLDFTLAKPPASGGKCKIALHGADINKIDLNMRNFELWFPEDDKVSSFEDTASVYEHVLKNFRDAGKIESYEILDVEYTKLKNRNSGGFRWYIVDTFTDWWWTYGYEPLKVFGWTLFFFISSVVFNFKFYSKLNELVYEIQFLKKQKLKKLKVFRKFFEKVYDVVIYTSIIFFGLKLDVDKIKDGVIQKHPGLFAGIVVSYVLGLVCLGFIANIIFTK